MEILNVSPSEVKIVRRQPPTPSTGLRRGKYDLALIAAGSGVVTIGPFDDATEARKYLQACRVRAVAIRKHAESGVNIGELSFLADNKLWGSLGEHGGKPVVVLNLNHAPAFDEPVEEEAEPEVEDEVEDEADDEALFE